MAAVFPVPIKVLGTQQMLNKSLLSESMDSRNGGRQALLELEKGQGNISPPSLLFLVPALASVATPILLTSRLCQVFLPAPLLSPSPLCLCFLLAPVCKRPRSQSGRQEGERSRALEIESYQAGFLLEGHRIMG